MIKKLISLSLCMILILIPLTVFAADDSPTVAIERDDNGYYFETSIDYGPDNIAAVGTNSTASTRTGSKTVSYKNADGSVMWYVKVTGKFTYGNGSSKCTSSSVTAASKSSGWTITSKSSSKSGNKAKASATGKCIKDGTTITKTVTLTCSSSGKLS